MYFLAANLSTAGVPGPTDCRLLEERALPNGWTSCLWQITSERALMLMVTYLNALPVPFSVGCSGTPLDDVHMDDRPTVLLTHLDLPGQSLATTCENLLRSCVVRHAKD